MRDVETGLRFAHMMMSINQYEGREAAIFSRALAELFVDKGIINKGRTHHKHKGHQGDQKTPGL